MTQAKIWSESPIIRLKLRAQFGARAARLLGLYCNSSVSVKGKTKVADRPSCSLLYCTGSTKCRSTVSGCKIGPFFGLAGLGCFCDIGFGDTVSLN